MDFDRFAVILRKTPVINSILGMDRDMIFIDVRLKNEDIRILQAAVGKDLDRIEHDEFVETNTSSQAVRFVLGDARFYLYSFTEPLDYYGAEEDVAVWSVKEKEYLLIVNKSFVSTSIQEKITAIHIVQEHQRLFENSQQTYDVWVTRGIIIDFGDHELAFEKPIWFSEDILIHKGNNLIERFQPVEEICKSGKWKDGITMECSREIMTL